MNAKELKLLRTVSTLLPGGRNPATRSATARLGMAAVAIGLLIANPSAMAKTKLSTRDRDFIQATAQRGMVAVTLGELASRKGMRDGVKEFGQMVAEDHKAINKNLKAVAAKNGLTLSKSLDQRHRALVGGVAVFSDSDFDNAYISAMSKVLKAEIRDFTSESARTKASDIKSFVDKFSSIVIEYSLRTDVMRR